MVVTYSHTTNFPRVAGALVSLLGIAVFFGWALDIPTLKTIMPGLATMKPNAAVGFILAGLSLYLTATHQTNSIMIRLASVLAFFVVGLGLTTLSEDVFGLDFGIDHMLFSTPLDSVFTPHPGRMAIFASISFFLIGTALLLLQHKMWQGTSQAIALFVMVFVAIPLGGHLFGDPTFPHIGKFTVIAPHAVIGLVTLSLGVISMTLEYGLLARLRDSIQPIVFNLAIFLLVLSGIASFNNSNRQIEDSAWISHTHEVQTELQGIFAQLFEVMADQRGFLLTGNERFSASLTEDRKLLTSHLDNVGHLTQDNTDQQRRLQQLKPLIDRWLGLVDQQISLRREVGLEAVSEAVSLWSGEAINEQIIYLHNEMVQAEQVLLQVRQARAKTSNVSAKVAFFLFGSMTLGLIVQVVSGQKRQLLERKQSELQIWHQANFDRLTDLPSRALFFDRLSKEFSQAKRSKQYVALLFLDLDGFKLVNDDFGHDAGDAVLKTVARRWQTCVRDIDTLARLGGDEFLVIVGGLDAPDAAVLIAEKLIKTLEAKITLPNHQECQIGVSIGISIFPDNASEMDSLLSSADAAMYESKSKGKNTFSFSARTPSTSTSSSDWIQFDDDYLVGVEEIDTQHQHLVQLANQFNYEVSHQNDTLEINRLFDELISYAAMHFATEHKLMQASNYPEQELHNREHGELIMQLQGLAKSFNQGNEMLVLQIIKDWVLGSVDVSPIR